MVHITRRNVTEVQRLCILLHTQNRLYRYFFRPQTQWRTRFLIELARASNDAPRQADDGIRLGVEEV